MFWLYKICYSCFRVSRTPRDAENLAAIPFGVMVFFPVFVGVTVFLMDETPEEVSIGMAILAFLGYICLPIVAGYFLIIKPFGYRKRIREQHAVITKYGISRKILNFVLFILIFFTSIILLPGVMAYVLDLLAANSKV